MNYFIINTASNLVIDVVATYYTPAGTKTKTFVRATDKALDVYYSWCNKNPGILPDIGDIIAKCKYLQDTFNKGKAKAQTDNLSQRYREPKPKPVEDREEAIAAYIHTNPNADVYAVSDKFYCGLLVANAYLIKYGTNILSAS